MVYRRRRFLDIEHEATIAGNRHNGRRAKSMFGADPTLTPR